MRTLAIGDIHGCLRALDGLLEMVRPEPDDLVIALGDYADRGPDSRGVIDRLIELREYCQLVCLRGNHDEMMMDARVDPASFRTWLPFGGRQTLESYAEQGGPGRLADVPDEHWHFLEATVSYYEIETHFFVHASVHPGLPINEQHPFRLFWEKLTPECSAPHYTGKIMVCGHSAQKSGVPLDLGHAICIDTYVYGGGWLTCLDVESRCLWQARQTGEKRTGRLGEPFADVE
jgi:serine/threonine protein phosphatase 1